MDSVNCAKCGTAMELGYVPDRNLGWYDPPKWFPGPLRIAALRGVAKSKSTPLYVVSYRCPACGYLESYAFKDDGKTA